MYNPQVIVDKIMSWRGCKKGDATHKHIIDTYNAHKPLARGYKVKYTDAWCATTVSAAAIECGFTDIIPTECSCNQMIALFKKIGCWQENDAYIPQMGDIIFYDWQDNGVGDNVGSSDHVGIVIESPINDQFRVCEGNKSNGVELRTMKVNGKYIRGYGVPKYDSTSNSIAKDNDAKPIKKEQLGIDVSSCQSFVDFDAVKKCGVEFVILRSTVRNGLPDAKFNEYYKNALNAKLDVSVYKYSYATNKTDAYVEAMGVIKLLAGRQCTIWLDLEDKCQAVKNKAEIAEIARSFLDYCEASGYDVGIYCNLDWYKYRIDSSLKKKYKFWIARYGKNDGTLTEKYRPKVGETIWQYTSKGNVNGVIGFVDMNVRSK